MHWSDPEMLLGERVGFGGMRDRESSANNGRDSGNKEKLGGYIILKILIIWLGGKWKYS